MGLRQLNEQGKRHIDEAKDDITQLLRKQSLLYAEYHLYLDFYQTLQDSGGEPDVPYKVKRERVFNEFESLNRQIQWAYDKWGQTLYDREGKY